MKIRTLHRLGFVYIFLFVALFLFSFTQVDLSLTLTNVSVFSSVQHWFQYIGFFNRPLATAWYGIVVGALTIVYILALRMALKGKITVSDIWVISIAGAGLLTFSYPAVSYDLFNYLFTAKTVLLYGKNPYTVLPQQFAGIDPFLTFMRWTHLPSAYTPLWILLTLPLYLISFNIFLPSMWIIKAAMAASYLGTIRGIWELGKKETPKIQSFMVALFALNPLVIMESLVGSHNDILMMMIAVWAVVFYEKGKAWLSWFLLSVSVAVKLMTLAIVPVFFLKMNRVLMLVLMVSAFIAVSLTREILPWYFLWIVPWVALLPRYRELSFITVGVSLALLLRYGPYFYFGNYDPPVPYIQALVTWIPIFCSVLASGIYSVRMKLSKGK